MLPDGFAWTQRYQYARGELALNLHGKCVAMLLRDVHGRWYARLDAHWPIEAPLVSRQCRTFTTGKAGLEEWARRHEARLRVEIIDPVAARRRWSALLSLDDSGGVRP